MLGKLIKYDIRATRKDFGILILIMVLAMVILPILIKVEPIQGPVVTIMVILSIALFIAFVVISLLNLFKLFNQNVYSSEGYLTLSLPVTNWELLFSKLIVGAGWILVTMVIAAIGLGLNLLFHGVMDAAWTEGSRIAFEEFMRAFPVWKLVPTIIVFVIAIFFQLVKESAKIFLACSIGHLRALGAFRVPLGVISYFAISVGEVFLTGGIALIFQRLVDIPLLYESLEQQFITAFDLQDLAAIGSLSMGIIAIFFLACAIYSAIIAALCCVANNQIMKRGLELQ